MQPFKGKRFSGDCGLHTTPRYDKKMMTLRAASELRQEIKSDRGRPPEMPKCFPGCSATFRDFIDTVMSLSGPFCVL
jgi:hypothetical protein